MPHPDFKAPGKRVKLTGRTSTLRGLFIVTLTPYIEPTDDEVDEALSILKMDRGRVTCAYCGGRKSEWDHFRPVVRDLAPTGYITEIANLVPACGKCNQSKSGSDWKKWILGGAAQSPSRTLDQASLDGKVTCLEAFERWREPTKIDYAAILGADRWKQHMNHLKNVLAILEAAEKEALHLRSDVEHWLATR
jgi:hypothetical protein